MSNTTPISKYSAKFTDAFLDELRGIVGPANVLLPSPRLERNSQDCFWYSPVLKAKLSGKKADVMVSPQTREEMVAVLALAVRERIPIVPRGAGTGNYGQSMPLHGGMIISTKRMTRILELTPEYAHVEAGTLLYTIEMEARKIGAELRFFPSTLPTSTAAGFIAGGAGGIGSIKWGNMWTPGSFRDVTVVTIEEEPQVLTISDPDTLYGIIHNCGLTAIIADLTFALAPREAWQQYVVAFDTYEAALRFGFDLAKDDDQPTRLVTALEWPIPSFFGQLVNEGGCPDGKSILLLHLTLDPDEVAPLVTAAGGQVTWHSPQANLHRGGGLELSDFSWNHTTLWAMKADAKYTYLQDEFDPQTVFEQLRKRKERYGDDVLNHVTFWRNQGELRPAGLTVIRFHSEEHLKGLMEFSESIGITQFNPHTTYLDEDARWNGQPILDAKALWDPHTLLNPGHLRVLEKT